MTRARSTDCAWTRAPRAAPALLALCAPIACASGGQPPQGAFHTGSASSPAGALDAAFARLLDGAPAAGIAAPSLASADAPGRRTSAWREARRRLRDFQRLARGAGARTLRIRLALREPRTGQVLEARGAVAIDPPDAAEAERGALRMILLGPGGTTALDLWAKDDRFRFAVPALDLLRRGDASTPPAALRGLPVDFLRWWLLRPAAGTLLWHRRVGATDDFVLRDGSAIIDLRVADGGLVGARRATWRVAPGEPVRLLDEETVIAERVGCGTVRYAQASTGLLITVTCEGEERDRAPDPRAFVDPDALAEGDP